MDGEEYMQLKKELQLHYKYHEQEKFIALWRANYQGLKVHQQLGLLRQLASKWHDRELLKAILT